MRSKVASHKAEPFIYHKPTMGSRVKYTEGLRRVASLNADYPPEPCPLLVPNGYQLVPWLHWH